MSRETLLTYESLDAPFGVVVRGIEWRDGPPAPEVVAELTRAMRRHLVLVFRGQPSPSHDQANAFWRGWALIAATACSSIFRCRPDSPTTKSVLRWASREITTAAASSSSVAQATPTSATLRARPLVSAEN